MPSNLLYTVSTGGKRTEGRERRKRWAASDRRIPWDSALCASQLAECPGRDALPFTIARTRTLAFYAATPLSSGTPYKVTNDCRSDSRRRVLNKDRTRLNYLILPAFTCRSTHCTWEKRSYLRATAWLAAWNRESSFRRSRRYLVTLTVAYESVWTLAGIFCEYENILNISIKLMRKFENFCLLLQRQRNFKMHITGNWSYKEPSLDKTRGSQVLSEQNVDYFC